jgi:hypothetical protein
MFSFVVQMLKKYFYDEFSRIAILLLPLLLYSVTSKRDKMGTTLILHFYYYR